MTDEQWNCAGCGNLCQRPRARGQRPKWCDRCRSNPRTATPCPVCSKPVAVRATYCSAQCFLIAKAEQAKHDRAPRSQVAIYTRPPVAAPQGIHARGHLVWRTGQCRICGKWFTTWNVDVTCSPGCQQQHIREQRGEAKHRRRARKKNTYVADVYRRKVFEADNYRCHICRRKCNHTKQVPHPRAPTIDHVIPLGRSGTHEPANCRTACFKCNATKGDRGGGEQFALAL